MTELNNYISQSREFGISDDDIKKSLIDAGWAEHDVSRALKPLDIPRPPEPANQQHLEGDRVQQGREGLSGLAQAMQHILLWFFTGSTTIALSVVCTSLFGRNVSTQALASYVAVVLVTFTPFALVYIDYLRKLKKDNKLVTGRVWSIITIVLHSVGALGSIITLVLSLILVSANKAVITSAASIAFIDVVVVLNYYFATFLVNRRKLRTRVLQLFLPVLFVFLSVFAVMALFQLGPAKRDEQAKKDIAALASAVRDYRTSNNGTMPNSLSDLGVPGIEVAKYKYERTGARSYKICADFSRKDESYRSYANGNISDTYVSEYYIRPSKSGENCFNFTYNATGSKELDTYPYSNTLD